MRYILQTIKAGVTSCNNTPDKHGLSFNPYLFPVFFQAYRWCIEAMKEITPGLPVKVVVDVLRQASKVHCVHLYYKSLLG